MTVTVKDLTPGTVYVFTKDLTFLDARWTSRTPGTHFIVGNPALSESGYTFSSFNTRTQRWDDTMAESWIFEHMRIVGRIPAEDPS